MASNIDSPDRARTTDEESPRRPRDSNITLHFRIGEPKRRFLFCLSHDLGRINIARLRNFFSDSRVKSQTLSAAKDPSLLGIQEVEWLN